MQISSKDKRILLISDIHQDYKKAERIINYEVADVTICLGDFFDSFAYNTADDVIKTCDFIKKYIFQPNFYTTVGNHDLGHFYDNIYAKQCSGYSPEKNKLIKEILGKDFLAIRDKFLWYIWVDKFICSHAGLSVVHFPPHLNLNIKSVSQWLDQEINRAKISLENLHGSHWTYRAGLGRGGNQVVGGLTWQCFQSEFQPIDGLKQIVGHTNNRSIIPYILDGSINVNDWENINIDCNLSQYLIINNRKLTIKKYADIC